MSAPISQAKNDHHLPLDYDYSISPALITSGRKWFVKQVYQFVTSNTLRLLTLIC